MPIYQYSTFTGRVLFSLLVVVKDSSAEPTGFLFTADGATAYVSVQHSNDTLMPKVDDYATDDVVKITGFKVKK